MHILKSVGVWCSGLLAACMSLLMTGAAMAQTTGPTIDTTAAVSFIEDQAVPAVAAVGAIVLLVLAVLAGYRYVRGATA